MSDLPASVAIWMPLYIKDRRAKVSTFSHLEHSALTYFAMLLWESGGKVADDDRALAKAMRLSPKQWQSIRPIILHDCTVAGGVITHPFTVSEVAKAKTNSEQKRKAGIASAEARKRQREGNGCSTAVATAVQPRAGGGGGPYQGEPFPDSSKGVVPFSARRGS